MSKIRVGIFGSGRGADLAEAFVLNNCEIVAVCEERESRIPLMKKKINDEGVTYYTDFDSFINHDMDAVVLANYFHQHAPYALKCFEKGIHVFSECISNGTMAEGVELIRGAKNSKSIYFLAENYPQMIFNREITKICRGGTLGKILYAEGEYNHPVSSDDVSFLKNYNYFPEHWRNFVPRTYYLTHSIGPIMHATGATPKRVTAFYSYAPITGDVPEPSRVGDKAAIMTTQNDDGSVFKIVGCSAFGAHGNSYRVCGTKGQIENLRGMGTKIMLRYNEWDKPEGKEATNAYDPQWNDKDEELIVKTGHGGADYLTVRMFTECIKEGRQPEHPFDLHSAVAMSSVAILAHRSAMEGGMPYDIPDFRNEEDCKKYENDRLSPFYGAGENRIHCCSHPEYAPTEKQLELFKQAIK